jgi:hypothetical protein
MRIVSALLGLVLGAACGLAAALAAAGIVGPGVRLGGGIDVDGWTSDWTIGSAAANPWTRARIARHGLLALTREEAVYFTRNTDDAGDRFSEACTYQVSGGKMPGQWWSVTVYDASSFLPGNTDNALSFDLTDAAAAGDAGTWTFTVSAAPAEGDWVSSNAAGAFDMTLRIYKPTPDLIAAPTAALTPPRVDKIACKDAI